MQREEAARPKSTDEAQIDILVILFGVMTSLTILALWLVHSNTQAGQVVNHTEEEGRLFNDHGDNEIDAAIKALHTKYAYEGGFSDPEPTAQFYQHADETITQIDKDHFSPKRTASVLVSSTDDIAC